MKVRYLLVFAILAIGAAFLIDAFRDAREAARENTCRGRLAQLHVALTIYAEQHGHLPPAYILGPDGKPWHSWRVLILPYFEEQELYDQYRFDEPWNGPNNRKLGSRIMEIFQCPSDADYERTPNTNYLAVVGAGTAFPDERTTRLADFRDGVENTILLVEVANSGIHWMEPRDLRFDSLTTHQNAESWLPDANHPAGPAVLFTDKIAAFRLQPPLRIETLRALLTIAGGEPVTRDSLVQPDRPLILSEAISE